MCVGVAFLAVNRIKHVQQEQSASLLMSTSEDKSNNSGEKRKKKKRKPSKSMLASNGSIKLDSQSAEDESGEELLVGQSSNSNEDLLLLASLSSSKVSNMVKKAPIQEIQFAQIASPVNADGKVAENNIYNHDNPSDTEQGWSRVPTRTEEIISNLKQKIESLNKQLSEHHEARDRNHSDFESQQRRWKEIEHDWRERVKALVQQVTNLENELLSMRANNQYLSEQCSSFVEVERRAERLEEVLLQNDQLTNRIDDLEVLVKSVQDALYQSETSSAHVRLSLESDLSIIRMELAQSKANSDLLSKELEDLAKLKCSLVSANSDLSAQLISKEKEICQLKISLSHIEEINSQNDLDVSHLKALNSQFISQLSELEGAAERAAWLEEAYSANARYIGGMIEAEQRQYHEKARLVQDLVSVRRQLASISA